VRSRAAVLSLVAGLAVMAIAQRVAPLGSPPLYDGVVVQDAYRYLAPGSGQADSPTSFTSPVPIDGTTSPQFVGATNENPPQAQLIASPGAFVLPAGVAALNVSIEPVPAAAPPSDGPIAGNVYRFTVADQAGTPLAIEPAKLPTLILRAPDGNVAVTIARYSSGGWQTLPTQSSGQPGIYYANVNVLGDYALVATSASGVFGLDTGLVVAAVVAAGLSAFVLGFLITRRRTRPAAVRPVPQQRRPRPSKRRSGGRRRGGPR
jgi:hypothetical protein